MRYGEKTPTKDEMGNTAAPARERSASPRREARRQSYHSPRDIEEDHGLRQEVEEITRPRTRRSSPARAKRSSLPRDPTTGRYLPRGQRVTAPRSSKKATRASSPRRKVEVQVHRANVPRNRRMIEVEEPRRPLEAEENYRPQVQFADEIREAPRERQVLRSSYTRSELEVEDPPVRTRTQGASSRTRSASPARRPKPEAEAPTGPRGAEARTSPRGTEARTSPRRATRRPEAEAPTSRRAPVKRQNAEAPTSRRGTEARTCPRTEAPVSRRDYASPSLASRDEQVAVGPSTVRRMKRMATTEVEADTPEEPTSTLPPVERLSTTAPRSDPGQVLFSYLNAA